MEVHLSIAIVTRNRPESLERTLISLRKQNVQPFEVLISDDSNSEEMIIRNKDLSFRFKCTYFKGPQKGLYANRNFVAKQSSGTHIRTMDDDHEFPENHLYECMKAINLNPDAIWTIGEYYPSAIKRPLPAPIPGQLHPRGFSYTPKSMERYYGISCGASIYPRIIIQKNILNVEIYKFGPVYLEYGARLFKNGFKINHLDTTYIIHYYDPDNRSYLSKKEMNSAKIFSILLLSFHYERSFLNITLTSLELLKGLLLNEYSLKIIMEARKHYRKQRLLM